MTDTFPTSPTAKSMAVISEQPTLISTTHSLKTQARSRGAQRFRFSMDWGVVDRATAMRLLAFGMAHRGQADPFYLTLQVYTCGESSALAAIAINTSAVAGATTVQLSGLPASDTVAESGYLIRFSGHNKLYILTADLVTDVAGVATATIAPALFAPAHTSEYAILDGVKALVRYANDTRQTGIQPGQFATYQEEFVEVI